MSKNNLEKISFSFLGQIKTVTFKSGDSILDTALRHGIPVQHSCGGMGTCGTCRIIITEGLSQLQPPASVEREIINDRGFSKEERLACQNLCVPGLSVDVPSPRDEDPETLSFSR